MGMLTPRQIAEIEWGAGVYYVAIERGMAARDHAWPPEIPAPHSKHGRLLRRVAGASFGDDVVPEVGGDS